MHTYKGARFNPVSPSVADIDVEIIAHSLSNQCRFNGLCNDFYSVAQHSVLVSEYVERKLLLSPCAFHDIYADVSSAAVASWEIVMAALMHDASEAYISDIPRPLKYSHVFVDYIPLEASWTECIASALGISMHHMLNPIVKEADDVMLIVEARDMLAGLSIIEEADERLMSIAEMEPYISAEPPRAAKKMFLERYYEIKNIISRRKCSLNDV